MATQTLFQERYAALTRLIQTWDRRLRAQQVSLWLPRCLLPGLALSVGVALISRLRPWLLSEQILLIAAASLLAGLAIMLLVVALWPRTSLQAARRFDLQFGLGERVSTALELIEGRIQGDAELVALQVDDAWLTARRVQPAEALPFVWRGREWAVVGALAAVLALLLILPNPQAEAVRENAAQQAAIEAAREELSQILQEVAANPTLTQQQREELLQALEASMDTLNQPDITAEEAFATLSDAQSALREQAQSLNDQSAAQQAALDAASQALQQDTQPGAEQAAAPAPIPFLNQLAQQAQNMTPEQMQQAAASLQQAAQALQQMNPQAAQALQQAAEALRQADAQAAQEALEQAAAELQQAAQNMQNQQASAQQLSSAAQQVQQSASQVGQAGQSQQGQQSQQAGQQGAQGQQGQQAGQSQQGQQSQQAGQQGAQGQQGQQGQGDNAAEGQGEGQPDGQQASSAQGGGQGQQGEQSGSQQGTEGTGSGAGDSPGGAGSENAGQQQSGPVEQNNNPDGQGEGQFEPVYAPQRIGGQGGPEIQLDPNASDAPISEGNFAQNPTGSVTVPYNQVFSDYSTAASRALEADYIPLGLRDVVRDYFSSLEPGQRR